VTVQIVRVLVFGGTPVAEDAARLGADPSLDWSELQFTFLEGVARGDEGLVYAWEVQTERELAAEAAEDTGETGPDLDRFRAAIAEARPIELPGLPTCRSSPSALTRSSPGCWSTPPRSAATSSSSSRVLRRPREQRTSSPACRTTTMRTTTRTGRWIQPASEPDGPRFASDVTLTWGKPLEMRPRTCPRRHKRPRRRLRLARSGNLDRRVAHRAKVGSSGTSLVLCRVKRLRGQARPTQTMR